MTLIHKVILIFILFLISLNSSADCVSDWKNALNENPIPSGYVDTINKCDNDLKFKIFEIIRNNIYLSYRDARIYLFSDIDNNNGYVNLVYSNTKIKTKGIPDPSKANCEHSWPQSLGATGKAKTDIHHLFPVRSEINSMRSNHPYCEVLTVYKDLYGSKYGLSKKSKTKCFEPIDSHKGDVARAMMYFSVRYNKPIDPEQEYWFKKWNKEDPVSYKEIKRNNDIEYYQNNRNPFVDYYQFADLIEDF